MKTDSKNASEKSKTDDIEPADRDDKKEATKPQSNSSFPILPLIIIGAGISILAIVIVVIRRLR